eukprot:scaffold13537_cov142-Skeletonema_marinoi.AAC.5
MFGHPSVLHIFLVNNALCLMQTPPFWAMFVHPSLLHRLTFALNQSYHLSSFIRNPDYPARAAFLMES